MGTVRKAGEGKSGQPPSRRKKFVRPRGKRGGAKNRKRTTPIHAEAIAKYHMLEKQIARTTDDAQRDALRAEQTAMGGLAVYQDQSTTGSTTLRGGESGKWCVQQLQAIVAPKTHLRILDIGAIAGTAYAKWKHWVNTTSIDLNPRAAHVHRADFFEWPVPAADGERYDVVGLSLVVNFVGDLAQRGAMLLHAHQYLHTGGYVYLVLPLACVQNSRYLTHDHLRAIVQSAGYRVTRQEDSARLTRWLLQQVPSSRAPPRTLQEARDQFWDGCVYKKRELVPGTHLNNFCILMS
ncbi:25S rRNA (adenine(2142)-N(1))-methyltransferase [Malassezia sp. CBS 17886]|nr:25S rRNA (adenine(2142)-N(1))-methyltransferase [Malassezia sp. CBS 17886]